MPWILRSFALLCCVTLSWVAGSANADIAASMDAMWNSTAPGAVHTPGKSGYDMGSYSLRVPVRNFTLVHIEPPRISMGCGGIDVHGGSFSLITAAAFKQMIRNIAQNAAGYLMYLALDMMCPSCKALLRDLQSMMTAFNSAKLNTCVANLDQVFSSFNASMSQFSEAVGKVSTEFSHVISDISDFAAGDAQASYRNRYGMGARTQEEQRRYLKAVSNQGNITYKLLLRSEKVQNLLVGGGSAFADQKAMIELMISIAGTMIVPPDSSADSATVLAATEPPPAGSAPQYTPGQLAPRILSLQAVRLGKSGLGNGTETTLADVFVCETFTNNEGSFNDFGGEDACLQMSVKPLDFIGIRGYVVNKLFGTSASAAAMESYDSGSIVANIVNGTPLTSDQAKFLSSTRFPAARLLIESNFSSASVRAMATHLVEPISNDLTVQFGRAVISTLRSATHGQGTAASDSSDKAKLSVPQSVVANLNQAENELLSMSADADSNFRTVAQIAASQRDMRALFGLTGRGTWNARLARASK